MTWLPVVEREMRVAARRRATYRIRFWAVLAMLGLFVFYMMEESNRRVISSQTGRDLLAPLTFVAFLFAISIGVIATSDSVSEEKREGTLGLLFLTDLKGYDVILGKLVAHSINAFYALVAIMPVLGMPLLMGGVTFPQFAKLIASLVTAIFLSLAAGIFVSTHSRNERRAMMFTFFLLLAITGGPVLFVYWLNDVVKVLPDAKMWEGLMFSPAFTTAMAFDPPSFFPSAAFWYGVAWSFALAVVLLLNAARTAPLSWTERTAKAAGRRPSARWNPAVRLNRSNRKLLDDNPFFWLAMRGEASRERVWVFALSIFAIWMLALAKYGSILWSAEVVIPTSMVLHLGLKIWAAGEASRRFIEDRRNNAMEFLLSTPLEEHQIIRGQWRALVRQFLWPVVFVLLWETVMGCAMSKTHDWYGDRTDKAAQLACSMFFLPLDIVALGWAGMWLGMTSKGRGRAMVIGLALVLLMPYLMSRVLVSMARNFGFVGTIYTTGATDGVEELRLFLLIGISLLTNLAVIIWAHARLLTSFRRMALASGSA